jgi:hypothetical protein
MSRLTFARRNHCWKHPSGTYWQERTSRWTQQQVPDQRGAVLQHRPQAPIETIAQSIRAATIQPSRYTRRALSLATIVMTRRASAADQSPESTHRPVTLAIARRHRTEPR